MFTDSSKGRKKPAIETMKTKIPWRQLFMSRIYLISLAIFFDLLLTDHKADAYYNGLEEHYMLPSNGNIVDQLIILLTKPFTRWDGQYFLRIAHDVEYKDEQTLAFFPGFPAIVGFMARSLYHLLNMYHYSLNLYSCLLLCGMIINLIAFIGTGYVLARLTDMQFGGDQRVTNLVIWFYSYNPASIFFSALYTESLFSLLTFIAILLVHSKPIHSNLYLGSTVFGLSCFIRSNGMISSVYIFYDLLMATFKDYRIKLNQSIVIHQRGRLRLSLIWRCIRQFFPISNVLTFLGLLMTHVPFFIVPFIVFQQSAISQFCYESLKRPDWCDTLSKFSYGTIQNKYWNVGFMKYWQLRQIPNFLMATPILLLVFISSFLYLLWSLGVMFPAWQKSITRLCFQLNLPSFKQSRLRHKSFWPYAVHSLVLALIALFYMNVQVATRFLFSANPWPYWALYDVYHNWHVGNNSLYKRVAIWTWLLSYYTLGTIAFANFYPFT